MRDVTCFIFYDLKDVLWSPEDQFRAQAISVEGISEEDVLIFFLIKLRVASLLMLLMLLVLLSFLSF